MIRSETYDALSVTAAVKLVNRSAAARNAAISPAHRGFRAAAFQRAQRRPQWCSGARRRPASVAEGQPAVGVGRGAVLHRRDRVVEPLGDRADLALVDRQRARWRGPARRRSRPPRRCPIRRSRAACPCDRPRGSRRRRSGARRSFRPHSRASVSTVSRVMPGRIEPASGGVTISSPMHDEQVHRADFLEVAALDRVEPQHLLVAARSDVLGGLHAGDVVGRGLGRSRCRRLTARTASVSTQMLHRLEAGRRSRRRPAR